MAANDYCTIVEIEEAMQGVDLTDASKAAIQLLITRASRMIDSFLKRFPGAFYVTADATKYFDGSGCERQWIGELAAAPTSVGVSETGALTWVNWVAADYHLWPYNAIDEGRPYTRIDIDVLNGNHAVWYKFPKSVKIVGKFGFSATIPDEIKQATIIQSVRWHKRGQQGFLDTGMIMGLDQMRYTKELDPEVKSVLGIPKFQRLTIG